MKIRGVNRKLSKLFKRCSDCGKWLWGRGTPTKVYISDKKGWPTDKTKIIHRCLDCEMKYDQG